MPICNEPFLLQKAHGGGLPSIVESTGVREYPNETICATATAESDYVKKMIVAPKIVGMGIVSSMEEGNSVLYLIAIKKLEEKDYARNTTAR